MNYISVRILTAVLLCFTLNSCIKKEDAAPQPFDDYNVVGEFRVTKNDADSAPCYVEAGFFPVAKNGNDSDFVYRFALFADSVLANGLDIRWPSYSFPLQGYLKDVDSSFANGPINWTVVGHDKVPSFTHLDTLHFADFNLSVPEKADKSQGLNVELLKISNTTNESAHVSFFADSLDNYHGILKTGWNVSLSPFELSRMRSGDEIRIVAATLVRDSVFVNGVRMGFNREVVKVRSVYVK